MPRYFFHVKNGIPLVLDRVGKELADYAAARAEARNLAAKVRTEIGRLPQLANHLHVEIVDDVGKVLGFVNLYPTPHKRSP